VRYCCTFSRFHSHLWFSNIYTRRVLAGEFQVVCPWLLRELVDLGLWDDDMKNMIIACNGSVQSIPNIPADVKAVYKTVWEISQKKVLDLAADRGAFICQSQSLNVHLSAPTTGQLTSMHFYGWKKGLKTGMYYLRTRPAAQAIQFTVDQKTLKQAQTNSATQQAASRTGPSIAASSPTSLPQASSSLTSGGLLTPSSSTRAATPDTKDAVDPEFAAALKRQEERKLAEEQLQCSLENKEDCLMCSG